MNLANRITLGRIAVVPLLAALLAFPGPQTCLVAFLVFLGAACTDFVDGFIARRWNMVTSLGKFLDPLADKLLVVVTLIMLAAQRTELGDPWVPAWVVALITAREITVTGLRTVALEQGLVLAADRWGKAKTVFQTAALALLTLHYPTLGFDPNPLGQFLLYIALVLTVFSGWNYCRAVFRGLRDKSETAGRTS